jgi:hypothetical protein
MQPQEEIMRRTIYAFCAIGATVVTLVLTDDSARAQNRGLPCDKITGGGWVFAGEPDFTGEKANFGAHGGCKNDSLFGHVNFLDRSFGNPPMHVRSTSITGYTAPEPNRRDICGTAIVSGSTGPYPSGEFDFHVAMEDHDNGDPGEGEPGGLDEFGIALSNGYILSTRELGPPGSPGGGGNIQLHKPTGQGHISEICGGAAPDPGP